MSKWTIKERAMNYYDFVKSYMKVNECMENNKYSNAGHTFCLNDDIKNAAHGLYWFYQGDGFIIDIHDVYITQDIIEYSTYNMADFMSIYSSYVISANGERFNPYQTITPNSLCTFDLDHIGDDFRYYLHKDSYYLVVSVGFERGLLENQLSSLNIESKFFYSALFSSNQMILTKSLEKVAMEILECKMESPAAEFFFKAKANEWISIVIDTYLTQEKYEIDPSDDQSLEDVSKFIDDHFAMNISQKTLEKISNMSGTKLKNSFREKYSMSITEYTQRKRMNIAEVMLLNTNLPIREIAESVGYSSHSKFSHYYKRYKGKLPREVRKPVSKAHLNFNCNHSDET